MQDQSPAIQDFLNGTPAGTLLSHKCIYRPGVLRTVIIMMLEAYYVYVYNTCALNIYTGDTNSHPAQELMHFCFRDVGSMNKCKPDEPGFHLHIGIVSTYKCSCVPCTIWIINLRARVQFHTGPNKVRSCFHILHNSPILGIATLFPTIQVALILVCWPLASIFIEKANHSALFGFIESVDTFVSIENDCPLLSLTFL